MLCVQVMFFFVSILHFYAYVTMFYRLVGAVMNLLQANSRFERSWHVSTQKSNTNLDYFAFNQSIKLKFSLYRAIWVCFTWIAHCTPPPPHPLPPILTPHPLSYTPGKECEELPVIGSLCLRKDSGIATRQTLQLAGKMYVKGWFDVQNNNFEERLLLFIRNGFGWCWYKGSVSFCFNNREIW